MEYPCLIQLQYFLPRNYDSEGRARLSERARPTAQVLFFAPRETHASGIRLLRRKWYRPGDLESYLQRAAEWRAAPCRIPWFGADRGEPNCSRRLVHQALAWLCRRSENASRPRS